MNLPVVPPVYPMLAKRVGELPAGDAWLFEPKWDGFRMRRPVPFADADMLRRILPAKIRDGTDAALTCPRPGDRLGRP